MPPRISLDGRAVAATPVSPVPATLGRLLRQRAAQTPDRPAHYRRRADGSWHTTTWRGFANEAAAVARGLVELGVEVGERIAVLGPTSVAWASYDLGGALAGTPVFGIYPLQAPDQIRYLLEHAACRVVFVADEDELDNVIEAARGNEHLLAIVPWETSLYEHVRERDPRIVSPQQFAGAPLEEDALDAIEARIDTDDTAILIYTSGTTGAPKGAMLSHRNVLSFADGFTRAFTYLENDLMLSFLPMAHVSERVFGFFARIHVGVASAYATSIGSVLTELPEVGPTVFGSVPRIYEKAFGKVQGQIAQAPGAVQALFRWAMGIGTERARHQRDGRSPSAWLRLRDALAHRLVFRKVHDAFGGRVRVMVSGAAPISEDVLRFFWAVGLPIYEAYGLTEASGGTHCNLPGAVRLGSVGLPVPGMEQRIADDGEVMLRGPLVFRGYHRNEAATREAIDADGWLGTGDIGQIDDDGFLRITDRKKHIIITAGGKNVAPASIERAIKSQSPLISQIHAHGDRRPFVSALIAPSPLETLAWGRAHDVLEAAEVEALTSQLMADPQARSPELDEAMGRAVAAPGFREQFVAPVREGNRELARVERVRRFEILGRDFSQEAGELTPTMKMKRSVIERTFADTFDRLYADASFGLDAEAAGH